LSADAPDVNDIVRKAITREVNNQRRLANYTWEQKSVERMLGDAGELKKTEVRVWEHLNLDGTSYRKLTEKDGKPLPAQEARKEQEKMDREIARRKSESASKRQERVREQQKREKEAIEMREEVMHAFQFRLEGSEKINGFDAWKIAGEPRADFKAKSREGKMLSKIRGKIWVEKQSNVWLRFEVVTLDKLTFGGFLASIGQGATLSAQQMRVNDELWHPEWFRIRLNARALLKKFNADVEESFRGFRKFQTESRIVETAEVDK